LLFFVWQQKSFGFLKIEVQQHNVFTFGATRDVSTEQNFIFNFSKNKID